MVNLINFAKKIIAKRSLPGEAERICRLVCLRHFSFYYRLQQRYVGNRKEKTRRLRFFPTGTFPSALTFLSTGVYLYWPVAERKKSSAEGKNQWPPEAKEKTQHPPSKHVKERLGLRMLCRFLWLARHESSIPKTQPIRAQASLRRKGFVFAKELLEKRMKKKRMCRWERFSFSNLSAHLLFLSLQQDFAGKYWRALNKKQKLAHESPGGETTKGRKGSECWAKKS